MTRNEVKDRVWDALFIYDSMPMKTKALCAYCGITPRQLQHAIRDLRMDGWKVCSGDNGYWLWDGVDDSWEHTKAQIRHRAAELYKLASAMDALPMEGQEQWLTI